MDFKKLLKTINTLFLLHNFTNQSNKQTNCFRYIFLTSEKFSLFFKTFEMGFRLPTIRRASFTGSQASSKVVNVPKGYLAVYVGKKMKRFVIPMSYLNQPSFQDLLSQVEEEFGYDHPMGGLTIPCTEDVFLHITSHFNGL
jgi:SAUR family protein